MPLPQTLKNFAVFLDGRAYIGKAPECNLPKLTIKKDDYRAGGMDVPIAIDMGMEKMECTFTLAECNANALGLFGLIAGADKNLVFRGAAQTQGSAAVPIVATIRGRVHEVDPGTWKAGDQQAEKYMISVNYYDLNVNGTDVITIDIVNMIRLINGSDEMASLRAALGM